MVIDLTLKTLVNNSRPYARYRHYSYRYHFLVISSHHADDIE